VAGCGETRTWWMGEAAIERLMEKMGLGLVLLKDNHVSA